MYRIGILAAMSLILGLPAGCKAQTTASPGTDPVLTRRIEILVRAQYELPPDYNLSIGARTPSQFPGYESLPITVSKGEKSQVIDFLISSDNTKLGHLSTFDLTKDPGDKIPISGRPIRGNPDAKVTVINFDDLECPYCAAMHKELFPGTFEHYKNLVRFVYKDDPLTELHPWAMHAAVDANCLAAQSGDVYWTYVDFLHAHGDEITGPDRDLKKSFASLDRVARQEGTLGKLDATRLDACIAKQDETQELASRKEADSLGIDGTPVLFVNGERISGALPQEQVWMVIDRALRAAGEQPPPETQPGTGASAGGSK